MAKLEDEFVAETGKSSLLEPLLNAELQQEELQQNVTSYSTAGLLSLVTISWLNPLLALGYQKHLNIEDVPFLAPPDRGREVYKEFKKVWQTLQDKHPDSSPPISSALIGTFWVSVILTGLLKTLSVFAAYVGPYLINDFVEFLGGKQHFPLEGYVLVSWFFIANVINSLAERHYCLGIYRLAVRVRACLTATLYEKCLRLSSTARQNRTTGEIINYMAVDVERVVEFTWWLHDIWILPLQVGLALAILYKVVGLAATLAALTATIATMLLNVPLTKLQKKFQEELMKVKDARMRTTSECLRNMRILKLQAWETEYLSRIEQIRASEYKWLAKYLLMVAASTFLLWTSPTIVAVTTFGTGAFLGVPLTPGRVLAAIATMRVLREPLRDLADLAGMQAQASVSLHRLLLFSQEPELSKDAVEKSGDLGPSDTVIEVEGGVFSWDSDLGNEQSLPTLRDVNLRVRKGAHVAICGPVGSGKSSLLACMLGEVPKLKGRVRVEGQTAYVAQTAWIQSGTFKENICFGKCMDETLYERVLQACDLKKDIALFPFGDETGIGERGINLSGGQKQRVQLARALYQEADVYYLDDPFSAVDAHTSSHLLKEVMRGMLASKTVVYVTHKMESLPDADHILVLRDGMIIQAGMFQDLLQIGTDFSTLLNAHNEALETMQINTNNTKEVDLNGSPDKRSNSENHARWRKSDIASDQNNNPPCATPEKVVASDKKAHLRQLVKEEERERGRVSYKVYWAYITAVAGGAFIPLYLLSQIGFQSFQILSSYWMAWGTSPMEDGSAKVSTKSLIAVYSLLAFSGTACVFLRTTTVSIVGLKTSQKYFSKMLQSIFRAPMSFFDSTPSGRILTRMSADQSTMDLEIQFSMSRVVNTFLQLLGIFVLMSTVLWQVLLLLIPLFGGCILFQKYYIASARELARLTSIQKSPIINHYGESISGAATIRGFHQEKRFIESNLEHLDSFAKAYFHKTAAREWLVLRMEFLSVLVYTICLVFIVSVPQGFISPSLAGVAITYGLNLSSALARLVWNVSALETTVVSVERISQYCKLPSEPPLIIKNARPASDWPSQGTIEINRLKVRYNAYSPLVLHGVSCTFIGGERVGIVGRTGSGKSTLIQALFRAVEPVGGSIVIDNLDISTIGLHDLRSCLSIIPQDPTLFEGNMRINLDPLGKYSDAEIWEALDKCQLGSTIRAKEQKLETSVSENGENWSVGQRQLVCLGRALLKQTRILVLDEATASVDSATDGLIQQTLRSEFSACTVLTIAHRIPTIIDSDKVLVLDNGTVMELDSPTALLLDQSSFFSKLVSEYSI